MRKRTIILAIAAMELATIPFVASLGVSSFALERSNVVSGEINSPPGIKQYFVTSEGAFDIVAENAVGPVSVFISAQGQIGQAVYGGASQLPGPAHNCAQIVSAKPQILYSGERSTIRDEASVIEQSVLVVISHDIGASPDIRFVEKQNSTDIPIAEPCR